MPKQKTKKSATRRFKITKNGKLLRRKSFRSHLNVKRSSKKRRKQRKLYPTSASYTKRLKKVMGVGK